MATQMELQNRYSDLLHPIKDLTRNWNVDVASQLEEYIEEVCVCVCTRVCVRKMIALTYNV